METIFKQIEESFATHIDGLRTIDSLPPEYTAYTIRQESSYGVAVKFTNKMSVYEESSSAVFKTLTLTTKDSTDQYLVLTCGDEFYRNEFAEFCTHFVEPGKNGANRKLLLEHPHQWWDHWIGLLGDKKANHRCYDVLGEMIVLDKLYQEDQSIEWASTHQSTHDIESTSLSYEVKSTIKRTDTSVTISSQFQLDSDRALSLVFIRLEESLAGVSINDMKNKLVEHQYDGDRLEAELNNKGLIKGNRLRDKKYKILECRIYAVDDNFPKITKDSFVDGKFPESITKIIYTIDLANLPYAPFKI